MRSRTATFLPACCVALASATGVQAGDSPHWTFDPVHSQVVFFVDHLGFSKAIGRAHVTGGELVFDPEDWSTASVDVSVALDTLDMGEEKWTATVRSSQFLDTARWPLARFRSSSVERTGADTLRVHGRLDLHGKEQPLTLDASLNRVGRDPYVFRTKAGFSAHATLDRFAFGLERYRDVVGADVELRIEIEAMRVRANDDKETGDGAAK
ncbi:MAG: polyisoprenoid-binding protein [Xanthomonadales bacterium]|nr:polyisoprenoid-binding protein [Xanthomonadales bacterium]